MEWFEETALDTFPYEISIWRRYVDDTFTSLCDSLIEDLTTHINSIDPAIKFTREEEINNSLAMLDTLSTRKDRKLTFTVYRKPTHTDQSLQFDSNQPLQHKLGVIRTLHHRCQTLCSNEDLKLAEIEHLKKVLSVSGYTKSAWETATKSSSPDSPLSRDTTSSVPNKGSITLPYVGPATDAVARNIRKTGVKVHIKPANTIRSKLVHPKDKINTLDQAGVVYRIQCNDCPSLYVGETERRLKTRVKEHHRTSSPVGHHTDYNNHSISDNSVSILHKESDWFNRGVAEAIHIQLEEPNLNRGRERHTLPAIYQTLLSRDDTTSPSGHGSREFSA